MDKNILLPHEIEMRSFDIITEEIGDRELIPEQAPIIKRVIHTSADFDYLDNLVFKGNAVQSGLEALKQRATIVTDTNMALSGINKSALSALGCNALCYIADGEVSALAKERGTTRAQISMEKSAELKGPVIYAIGNAPTALMALKRMTDEGTINPALIIAVPVGFVNVVESKEEILKTSVPIIAARGRKGGSNVAAAICNALLYMITREAVS